MKVVIYDSNNSGGDWWLTDQNWKDLQTAGWFVNWEKERWLGALAISAKRYGLSEEEAISEFETITGESAEDPGCPCCGQPHEFYCREEND